VRKTGGLSKKFLELQGLKQNKKRIT
jgi:hypothetical protein